MTRIAILSDIHANRDALELALKDMEKKNVDKIVCLGDLVTKYFYPAEVVDSIRANADVVLKGNCDYLVSTDERYKFARGKLGLERIEYLSELPITEQILINKTLLNLYHSMPGSLEAMFNPQFSNNEHTKYKDKLVSDYNKMFVSNDPQISVVGHTHHDYIGVEEDNDLHLIKDPTVISNKKRAVINVGSVGEHSKLVLRNGVYVPNIDPYLTYAIIDDKDLKSGVSVSIERVPYADTLKKVYMNMVQMQDEKRAPFSPSDTKKVHDSLINMGYEEKDIKPRRM